jgi:toxin ParE1/3/4
VEEIWQVHWTPEALEDLGSLRDFIAARNPVAAAAGVLARIFEAAARLARFPRIGHHGRVPGTRESVVSRTPYFLVYRVEEPAVEILRIMHGARQWPPE